MPKPDQKHPTFADAIATIEHLQDLTPTRRRDLISALKTMARFIGREVDHVPANTEWLRQRLRQVHPRQLQVSDKHFQNVKSAVLFALRMTVSNNKRHAAFPDMSAAFQALFESVPDRMQSYKLSRLFRFCSAGGVAPEQVCDQTIADFKAQLIAETLHKEPDKVVREAVLTWNKMQSIVPDWPDQPLTPVRKRKAWTIPLEQFPASFVSDVDLWCARLGHQDLFDADAPVKPCRPATIKHRRFQVRMMASAIVLSGVDILSVQSLADLVELDNFQRGISYMLDRQDGAVKEANFTLASAIKAIARYHVKLPEAHLDELRRLCAKMDRAADRYRKNNKDRLDQFDDDRNLALLLGLPARLAQLAQKPGPKPRSAALLLQSAVAIEILLFCPMRVGNLAHLDIERHLRWIGDNQTLRLIIDIPAPEVKNDKPLRYELTGTSATLVRDYIDRVRPCLCSEPSSALFPKMDGRYRNPGDLSTQIKRHCLQETGLTVNAHLFRSLASKVHNKVSAGDAVTISHVLGDKITTVLRSYAQFEQKSALDHFQQSVRIVRGRDDQGEAE